MQLTEAIEALLIATRADGRSQETIKGYRRKLRQFLAFFGDVPVEEITTDDVRRYIAHLWDRPTRWADHPKRREQAGGLSPYSVAGHVRAVKRLFNFLEAEGVIEVNPTRRIKTPDPRQKKLKAIALQDFLALLAITEGQSVLDRRDRAIILLLADTGCRVGGLCSLRVQDVNLERGLVTVIEKGSKTRLVPFTRPTSEALQAWLKVRPQSPWRLTCEGVLPVTLVSWAFAPEWLTLEEASALSGHPLDVLDWLIEDGAVETRHDGDGWLIEKASLREFQETLAEVLHWSD